MSIIGKYKNGNYHVVMMSDGSKIRYNDLDHFTPYKPESIDLKITNRCFHNCPMCFAAGTKVLMGDLTYKNIEDVQIGDVVIGFEESPSSRGAKRKMIKTKVLNTFVHVESEFVSVTTDTKNNITATPNHPFLSEGTGKNHARNFNKIGSIPVGNDLFECGFPIDFVDYNSSEYALGYTVGSWAGDGCFQHYIDKNGYDAYICRFVTKDDEINDMVYKCSKRFLPELYRLDFKMSGNNGIKSSVRSNKKDVYDAIVKFENDNIGINISKEYACGFLAGFFDSEGHIDNQRSIIRLFNTNMKYINEVTRCLDALDIDYVIEEKYANKKNVNYKDCFVVRVKGQYSASRFLWYTRPVCNRKGLDNYLSKKFQYHKHKIVDMKRFNKKQYVYNLETECHTYIANNFLVHNCHEDSTPNGKHGDIMNLPFLDTMLPYSEIAIGGGNVLLHPDLIPFLESLKKRKLIANMTVNQIDFMENIGTIRYLVDSKLVYGLGVSLTHVSNEFIKTIKQFPNAVIHIINGLITMDTLHELAFNNLKILILGYKEFRRGETLYSAKKRDIDMLKSQFYDMLPTVVNDEWFDCVSFDNLAIKQLEPKRLMDDDKWKEFYLGDDGFATMYIDAVERKFAKSSTSTERFDITDDIKTMFDVVREV